jgi:uncharacterized membrane protein YozB (DUF420 family)
MPGAQLIGHISATTALFALLWILSALNFARRAIRREEINYHEFVLDIQIFVICFVMMLYFSNISQ